MKQAHASSLALAAVVAAALTTSALAAPFRLTSSAANTIDDWPTAIAAGNGFYLAWQHYDQTTGNSGILLRRHGPTGAAASGTFTVVAPTALIGRPRLLPEHVGKLAIVWAEPGTGINGRTITATTAAMGAARALTKPSTVHFDPARLSDGSVAVSHTVLDTTAPSDIRNRVALTTASSVFAPATKDRFVTASNNPMNGPASFDHAVAPGANGASLNFYRDRTDFNLYLVKATATDAMAATRTRVNTTAMRNTSASEMAFFGVQAVRLTDGRTAVAWTSPEQTTLFTQSLRLRFLDPTGKPVGLDQKVNVTATGGQFAPRLVAVPGGRLGVAWTQDEGTTRYHRIRWYRADGKPSGLPKTLRSDTEVADSAGSRLALLKDGRVLQVYRRKVPADAGYTIWGEFLTPQ